MLIGKRKTLVQSREFPLRDYNESTFFIVAKRESPSFNGKTTRKGQEFIPETMSVSCTDARRKMKTPVIGETKC